MARDLLGRVLCRRVAPRRVLRGRVVEVEAYDGPQDRACHGFIGRTKRNEAIFRTGGIVYVYLIYGMHHCLNVVTGENDYPSAILIRASEAPVEGANASGPGRLCRVFDVDREQNGCSLAGRELWLEAGEPVADREVRRTPRIGVDYAGVWAKRPYRFVLRGHPDVSGPKRLR